jgi:hypothetical protein
MRNILQNGAVTITHDAIVGSKIRMYLFPLCHDDCGTRTYTVCCLYGGTGSDAMQNRLPEANVSTTKKTLLYNFYMAIIVIMRRSGRQRYQRPPKC